MNFGPVSLDLKSLFISAGIVVGVGQVPC